TTARPASARPKGRAPSKAARYSRSESRRGPAATPVPARRAPLIGRRRAICSPDRATNGSRRRPGITLGVTDEGATLFRRFHEAWSRGDLATVRTLVDPDVVARPLHGLLFTAWSSADWTGSRTGTTR